jgi:DTW domain-containing protein YfiP
MVSNAQHDTWHRLKNDQLAHRYQDYCLIYPDQNISERQSSNAEINEQDYKGFLWIDSTWQQSHKMLRQSPWLNELPKKTITGPASTYKLRRNQKEGGLSTLESMAYWLMHENQHEQAQELLQFFQTFQDTFLKVRLAGLLT